MTTIRDVAERALVSVGTVSRVLNDHPSVNPAIRRAVLTAIDELQYRPSAIARTLSTGRTGTLALLLPSMRNAEVVSAVIQGAEAAAHEHGYALVIANTHGDPRIDEQYVKNLLDRRIEGLVCSPAMDIESLHCLLEQAGVPGVVLGTPGTPQSLTVAQLSFAPATEEAIDHLLALGHRRIGTITHASQSGLDASAAWGVQFIRRALDARGIETRRDFHLEARSAEECIGLVRDMASAEPHPTALFVTPLFLVPATLTGVRAAGAHVPLDISVIGLGDSEWAQVVDPPLSVVAADLPTYAAEATRALIALIEHGSDRAPELVHDARYIRRASVGPPDGRQRRRANGVRTDQSEDNLARNGGAYGS